MLKRPVRPWIHAALTLCGLTLAAPAWAISLNETGTSATLSGTIEAGDDGKLDLFLAKPRPAPLRLLYLESEGGLVRAAIAMARAVRRARLSTAVRAQDRFCDSACTLIFAGGVKRFNIGGGAVFEGFSGATGLGYHPAHVRGDRYHPSVKSDDATREANALYAEMGSPGAATLTGRAGFNTIFRPGGKLTLDLHIATSLDAP